MGDLVKQLRERPHDHAVWSAFYRHFHALVYYTAYKLIRGDVGCAEDLTQDVFLRFYRYKAYLRVASDERAGAYLRQVTRRLVWDLIQARAQEDSRRHLLAHEHEATYWIERFDDEDRAQLALDVERLASYLSQADRELLERLLQGESIKDTAGRLNVTYEAAAVRMHRLRRRIENYGRADASTAKLPRLR